MPRLRVTCISISCDEDDDDDDDGRFSSQNTDVSKYRKLKLNIFLHRMLI